MSQRARTLLTESPPRPCDEGSKRKGEEGSRETEWTGDGNKYELMEPSQKLSTRRKAKRDKKINKHSSVSQLQNTTSTREKKLDDMKERKNMEELQYKEEKSTRDEDWKGLR